MSHLLNINAEYSEKMKTILKLRWDPVAVKLIKPGEEYPDGPVEPESSLSHCQAVFRARKGECLKVPYEMENCRVGTAVLGMSDTPEKVASGEFHAGIGIHDSAASAKRMIDDRILIPYKTAGEVVCPLKNANFIPDAVIVIDVSERIFWIMSVSTAEKGERAEFSTAPFQCTCEDIVAMPMVSGRLNVSFGCFGCRKRTDMTADEIACGMPYSVLPEYVKRLERYADGPLTKAKRE